MVVTPGYVPYVIQNENGTLSGLSIELWKLWEIKTGIKVEFIPVNLSIGLNLLKYNNADVIDCIFYEQERDTFLDYASSYDIVNTSIFFKKDILGISDINSLKGMKVGIVNEDFAQSFLISKGISNLYKAENNEKLIESAANEDIKVFVADDTAVNYFLYKYGISSQFNKSSPIYSNKLYRAVSEGNRELIDVIDLGFSIITENEKDIIIKKWKGQYTPSADYKEYIIEAIIIIIVVIIILFIIMFVFRKIIKNKTNELRQINDRLNLTVILEKTTKSKLMQIINAISNSSEILKKSETEMISFLFHSAMKVIVGDAGYTFIIFNKKVRFIEFFAYDMIDFKNIDLNREDFENIDYSDIKLFTNFLPEICTKMSEDRQNYIAALTKNTKSTLFCPFFINHELYGGFCFELNSINTRDFMAEDLEIAKAFKSITESFLLQKYNNNQISKMNLQLYRTAEKEKRTKEKFINIIKITSNFSDMIKMSDEEVICFLFRTVFKIVEVDYGSVKILENNRWKYIDAIGHNSEKFRNIFLKKEWAVDCKDIKIIEQILTEEKLQNMPPDVRKVIVEASKPIKSTIICPIFLNNKKFGEVTFDLAVENPVEFTIEDIEIVKTFKEISENLLMIKRFNNILNDSFENERSAKEKFRKLIDLIVNFSDMAKMNDEEFLSLLLRTAISIIGNDCGSVYKFIEDRWYFIDAIGHNINILKEIELKKEWSFAAYIKDITEIKDINNLVQTPHDVSELFNKASIPIKNTIVCPLFINNKLVIGLSFDLSYKIKRNFTKEDFEVIKAFKEIAETLLSIKYFTNIISETSLKLEEYNKNLEEKVMERTTELETAQKQIIVQEKLASLGALTAGIAHEIKNPLNFICNFAELSIEFSQQLSDNFYINCKELLESEKQKEIEELITILIQNSSKIKEHGKRITNIVNGMLEHSRGSRGEFKLCKINDLIEESLNLSYHGMRAQNMAFNVKIEKDYESENQEIKIIPEDIRRALLNIIGNAMYEVNQKNSLNIKDYIPAISIKTMKKDNKLEIHIKDNGNGVEDEIKNKIFEPFFTTKPSGSGTGLGLSISYDIIVNEHKGNLIINSVMNEFSDFIIELPLNE